ncbi:class I SAM-dependent methyltransferase [Actinomadura sp. GC306]|uniref:SAM-dependent methyltransferase n=1 Tax=Actinomadura sp. GC306 TaxID=2530367 RepID=UPI00104BE859|nr:class I SAM-dependent methyltransferase [Actinomadura sp. GC306]TDC61761.1 class I SAM-dependent methyltransferase [Actinomadura sp. GC306]
MVLSPRLSAVVDALPLGPDMRVLEIGCGTGAAARAVAARLGAGHILAIDRSAKAVAQTEAASAAEIAAGRMSVRRAAIEDFEPRPGEGPFDLVYAIRVGALDGRHPEAGREALARIAAVLAPGGRVFIDGGDPLREVPV